MAIEFAVYKEMPEGRAWREPRGSGTSALTGAVHYEGHSYDLSPIDDSGVAKHNATMKKPFTLMTSAACLLGFLILVPASPGETTDPTAKLQALSQQLKLTPQQKVQMLPILKEEGPKIAAIKNNPSLPPMQKMKQLRAIHNQSAPQLQKILSPAQYQQLQGIRQQEIQQAIAKKRAGG